jgi:hypothetical protein
MMGCTDGGAANTPANTEAAQKKGQEDMKKSMENMQDSMKKAGDNAPNLTPEQKAAMQGTQEQMEKMKKGGPGSK